MRTLFSKIVTSSHRFQKSKRKKKRRITSEGANTNKRPKTTRQWSNLPYDILHKISEFVELQLRLDFQRRLRAVCTSWRAALPLPQPRRLQFFLKVPNISKYQDWDNAFLLESTIYLISPLTSKKSWLMRVEETNPNKWHLVNPFSGADDLFDCSPAIRADINLSNNQIREVTRSYSLVERSGEDIVRLHARKVVGLRLNQDKDLTVLALCHGELALWKYGEEGWITSVDGTKFADIAVYKGNFYAVEEISGNVCILDPSTSTAPLKFKSIIAAPPEPLNGSSLFQEYELRKYLVQCRSQLFYVINRSLDSEEDNEDCSWISVLVLNDKVGCWDSVRSLENDVVFLLGEVAFSVSAADLGRESLGGNICFVAPSGNDGVPISYCDAKPKYIKGLNSLDSFGYLVYPETFARCQFRGAKGIYPSARPHRIELIHELLEEEHEEYTSIFFPPPPWIKWCCPDRDNAQVGMANLPFIKHAPNGWYPYFSREECKLTDDNMPLWHRYVLQELDEEDEG